MDGWIRWIDVDWLSPDCYPDELGGGNHSLLLFKSDNKCFSFKTT